MMNAHYRLKSFSTLPIVALLITGSASSRPAFKRGQKPKTERNFEAAMAEYRAALQKDPDNIEYRLKFEQARFAAAFDSFENGRRALERADLESARRFFERTLEIDPTHVLAEQELARVNQIITSRSQNQPVPGLNFEQMKQNTRTDPSDFLQSQLEPTIQEPFSMRLVQNSRVAFETLAQLAGLNVVFDTDFRPAPIQLDLNNVTFFEALDILLLQTKMYWKPLNKNTILIYPDNQTTRRNYEDLVFKTIYLTNSVSATEITEAITALRTLLNMSFIAQSSSTNAILLRDTPDKIAIAEQIISSIDKAKPEVVVEATVLEVDRNQLRELG